MIHICFNLDEKYLMPCKVLIRGIESNTKENITFHLIGIDKVNMGCKSDCKYYPNPDLSLFKSENLKNYGYFSKAAMYRLLIPVIIPADKVIYLDIDTIVTDDIKNLWKKRIDYAGAVIDPCSILHKNRLNAQLEDYYNSGVIVFNCKKIRENMPDYKERIIKIQEEYVLHLKDQDIFNIIFKDHITNLGYEWNIDAHNLKEKEESKRVSRLKDKAFEKPSIIHCMGKEKWWNYDGLAFCKTWDKYAKEYIPQFRKTCIRINGMLIIRN